MNLKKKFKGQSLVEFALTLPIFLVVLMMMVEIARIGYAYITLESATRTAARYAVTGRWMQEYALDPEAHWSGYIQVWIR